jgi:hypothetical protein
LRTFSLEFQRSREVNILWTVLHPRLASVTSNVCAPTSRASCGDENIQALRRLGKAVGVELNESWLFGTASRLESLLEISLLLHAVSFHVFRFVVGEFPVHSGLYASRARRTLGLIKPVEQFSEKVCPVIYQGLTECVPAAAPPYHRSTRAMLTTTTNALSMWPTTRTF